jgi:chaperonin GroEL
VASLLLTTEGMVAELPKEKPAPAVPGSGMGGVDF